MFIRDWCFIHRVATPFRPPTWCRLTQIDLTVRGCETHLPHICTILDLIGIHDKLFELTSPLLCFLNFIRMLSSGPNVLFNWLAFIFIFFNRSTCRILVVSIFRLTVLAHQIQVNVEIWHKNTIAWTHLYEALIFTVSYWSHFHGFFVTFPEHYKYLIITLTLLSVISCIMLTFIFLCTISNSRFSRF